MASSIARCGISEEALIWTKVKKVLAKKGAQAAQETLKAIRLEQTMDKINSTVSL